MPFLNTKNDRPVLLLLLFVLFGVAKQYGNISIRKATKPSTDIKSKKYWIFGKFLWMSYPSNFAVKHPWYCLAPRRLSLHEHVHAKEGGKEPTGETGLRLPSVRFPWSLVVHHQSLASTLRKTKRLRKRLSLISPATRTWTSIES